MKSYKITAFRNIKSKIVIPLQSDGLYYLNITKGIPKTENDFGLEAQLKCKLLQVYSVQCNENQEIFSIDDIVFNADSNLELKIHKFTRVDGSDQILFRSRNDEFIRFLDEFSHIALTEYTIKSFTDGFNDYFLMLNGKFTINTAHEYNLDDLIKYRDVKIKSVLRNSDKVLFTIGDIVTATFGCDYDSKISSIMISDDKKIKLYGSEVKHGNNTIIQLHLAVKKPEKSWRIISFRATDGLKMNRLNSSIISKHDNQSQEEFEKYFTDRLKNYEIYEVERLNDYSIFTIGEMIMLDKNHYIVDDFIVNNDKIVVKSTKGKLLGLSVVEKDTIYFKTEDDISISKFNISQYKMVYVNPDFSVTHICFPIGYEDRYALHDGRIFSSVEAANLFVEENKPIYSKKDLEKIAEDRAIQIICKCVSNPISFNVDHPIK